MVWMDGWLWIDWEDEWKIGLKRSRNGNNDIGRQDRHRRRQRTDGLCEWEQWGAGGIEVMWERMRSYKKLED
jgi:hypothetical protein